MAAKSLEDQERDIGDLLRKAERNPVKTSAMRKDALKRLIDLAHSPQPKLKIIVANNIKSFIKDFPELEDDAINAVYDLCEDQVTKVRISGYKAIVDVSREQHKWVKRNADVLVQLLQSDEPDEVLEVKRSLSQHLDMDPAVTLGVLCDQIVPPDEPMDEEEQAIRNRLRSLVLSFITGSAKRAIVERHCVPESAAEETLVSGLLKAISKLTSTDIDVIVKEILFSLSSFKPSSPRGRQLLEVVLDRARAALKVDLAPGSQRSTLQQTRYFLDLASYIAVEKHVAQPAHLLRFYFTSLSSKITLLRLDEDAQVFVLSHIAEAIASYEGTSAGAGATFAEDTLLRKQIPDICVVLLQVFAEGNTGERRPWQACQTFLRACQRHKTDSKWAVPSHLATILQNIQSLAAQNQGNKLDNIEDIQSLIRPLLPSTPKPVVPAPSTATATDISKGMNSSNGTTVPKPERRIMNIKRKYEDRPATLPPRPHTTAAPMPPSSGAASMTTSLATGPAQPSISQARQRASTFTANAGSIQKVQRIPSEEQFRAAKRARMGSSGVEDTQDHPSLLSRLAAAATPVNGRRPVERMSNSVPAKRRVESAPISFDLPQRPPQDPDKDPVGGYSIKGAARAADHGSPSRGGQIQRTSLLARLQGDDGGWDSAQRKKKRTKT